MAHLDQPSDAEHPIDVPMQAEFETRMDAAIVTFEDRGVIRPGGMCGCCGSGPKAEPDWRADPWYVYRAGFCDSDGVYYSMLCESCREEIRFENAKRVHTERDETARQISELMGDDIDGAQSFMDDLN